MRETVRDNVRGALHAGRFRSGQALSEAALAAEMGVSRGPVREALLLLVQEGLVTHSPNRGFSVVYFSEQDVQEIHQVRLPLEATALELARDRISPEEEQRLTELKHTIVKAHRDKEYVLSSRTDMEFHNLIWEKCGNARLHAALSNLLGPFFAYGSLFNDSRPQRTPEIIDEEHACYLRFLKSRETRSAEACVRFHLAL